MQLKVLILNITFTFSFTESLICSWKFSCNYFLFTVELFYFKEPSRLHKWQHLIAWQRILYSGGGPSTSRATALNFSSIRYFQSLWYVPVRNEQQIHYSSFNIFTFAIISSYLWYRSISFYNSLQGILVVG